MSLFVFSRNLLVFDDISAAECGAGDPCLDVDDVISGRQTL